jgi:hypothetical protein
MARVSQPALREIWKGPLVAGLCFGVAYGVTQRLLSFNVTELIRFGPGFDVQVFPGTSLESLRLRFGDAEAEIRGDLELQELERQQQQEAKQRVEAAKEAEAALKRADAIEPQVEPPAEPQLPAASSPAPLPPVAPPPSAPAPPL